jgi:8-oxo-dGTP diphosphatase
MEDRNVRVGCGVLIVNPDHKILLGKRMGSHGAGEWSLPGGHLEWKESFDECCRREIQEETGIELPSNVVPLTFTNDIFEEEDLHYVTLFFGAFLKEPQEAVVMELDKCEEWIWSSIDNLPQPLFLPLENILKESKEVQRFIFCTYGTSGDF